MKKKIVKKARNKPAGKKVLLANLPKFWQVSIRYVNVISLVLTVLAAGKFVYSFVQTPRVLGASVFLADTSGSTDSGSMPANGDTNINNAGVNNTTTSPNTFVDCVGPDGRHFQTTFQACYKLNSAYGHPDFSFTRLQASPSQLNITPAKPNPTTGDNELDNALNNLQKAGQTENQLQGEAGDLQTPGVKVELNSSYNQTNATLREPDGTTVAIDKNTLIQETNNLLKEKDIEISTDSAHGLKIRKGQAQAETDFPLSINPVTKTLTVTTPAGAKQVMVLPDQAVENVMNQKIFTNVEGQTTPTGTVDQTTLTQLNNQPVFEVNGVSDKHFLGLIPMSFAKTAFVSTQTGNIVQINETLLTRILESMSL